MGRDARHMQPLMAFHMLGIGQVGNLGLRKEGGTLRPQIKAHGNEGRDMICVIEPIGARDIIAELAKTILVLQAGFVISVACESVVNAIP